MCGIAGILAFNSQPSEKSEIASMLQALHHRGPDGEGTYCSGPIALGHRRLSIIDLQTGAQPMCNENGRVWVTYNGELYNYRKLRAELQVHGHIFKTTSDTEVIVHAWEQWGESCVERFRGMFAFAIADYDRHLLFVARDHLGIKPVYYFSNSCRIAFASELQALRVLPDCPNEIDPVAIDNFLFLLYVPAPRTIYRRLFKLPPAHRMTVTFDGKTKGPENYWTLTFAPDNTMSFDDCVTRLRTIVDESVKSHTVSDVPYGAFLSGGIDSTAIVAAMAKTVSPPVRTFSIGFDEERYSELQYARAVARKFETDHHEEIVRPDAAAIISELVKHYGEPFGDSSAIPTYFVSRLARRHVSMVLTGDGGDEAFFGYPRHFYWHNWVRPSEAPRPAWQRIVRPVLSAVLPQRFPLQRDVRLKDWLPWVTAIKLSLRSQLWRPEFHDAVGDDVPEIDRVASDALHTCPDQYGQYLDCRTYLPHDILTKVDIASMCHGLETRTPLTDVRVFEFASTIPWRLNLAKNSRGMWTGKQTLKATLRDQFGPDFLERPKAGFAVPLTHWFAPGGSLRRLIEERLFDKNAKVFSYFRPEAVRQLITEHAVDRRDNSQTLWQLFFLESWLEQVHAVK